jgi:hypothetical protein
MSVSFDALGGMLLWFGDEQQRRAAPLGEPVVGSAARNLSWKRYLTVEKNYYKCWKFLLRYFLSARIMIY